ncbi:MAG: universal stress protein [Sandaracinaceae bacterium]
MSTSIRRILCPVDFSEPSTQAYGFAVDLARALGAELHLAHAYQLPVYALPDGAMMPTAEVAASVSAEAQASLDAMPPAEGVTTKRHLTEGVPHKEIDRLVDEYDIDLVVMGTHGRTGIARLLVGSVAERVVRTCTVPVITVPPKR